MFNIKGFKIFSLCETKAFRISECNRATFGNKNMDLVLSLPDIVRKEKELW